MANVVILGGLLPGNYGLMRFGSTGLVTAIKSIYIERTNVATMVRGHRLTT